LNVLCNIPDHVTTMYQLEYFRFIQYVPTQFDQHFPDRFVQNILAMFSQYTKLGKLKTHG